MHFYLLSLNIFIFHLSLPFCLCSSSSAADMSKKRGQKILSYVIFHRHGQRAPTKNIYEASHTTPHHAPHRPLAEAETWEGLLASALELDSLQELYPVRRHPLRELQSDLNTKPFGCLTSTGLEHLEQKGRATREAFPALASVQPGDLQVFATNYQRTQASAQAFLKGLGAPTGTSVEVLASEDCPLSFYDHDPALAVKLTKQVQSTSTFRQEESDFVDSHGVHLMSALPELATASDVFTFNIPLNDSETQDSGNKEEGSIPNATKGTEIESVPETETGRRQENKAKRINWMAALDYFACRSAHQLPLHAEVQHFGARMKEYVGSRFTLYYTDEEFRRLAVLPMLNSVVLKEFTRKVFTDAKTANNKKDDGDEQPPPSAVIYSGHDVNLLGLLVTLNASVVQSSGHVASSARAAGSETGAGVGAGAGAGAGHWPDYGSSLVFELVQDKPQGDTRRRYGDETEVTEVEREREGELLVNVYYNHQPLSFQLPRPPPPYATAGTVAADTALTGDQQQQQQVSHSIRLTDLKAFCDQL